MCHLKIYNYFRAFLIFLLSFTQISCKKNIENKSEGKQIGISFSTNQHYILKNNIPLNIKGVVYVPCYPGFLPWEIERNIALPNQLKESIKNDLFQIKKMGANTVRLWGAPKYCYEVIKEIGDLNIIQVIWIDGEATDFQNTTFKSNTKNYIKEVIDRVYSVFNSDEIPIIAFTIGNELSKGSIFTTNSAHSDLNHYTGRFIKTDSNINASEAFIAEMADFARSYEFDTYNHTSLLTYSNEIRTFGDIDIPFLDFISHNAYSYAVPYYRPQTKKGGSSGTYFQGWIEEIKAKNPTLPLLITETGLSVSPNANHIGPPNYGYGGNTENEQSQGILQNLEDIETCNYPIAGVCIHEYLDAWWKFGLEDSYSQDPNDIEEWFGIVKLIAQEKWYSTEPRMIFFELQKRW